MWMKAVQSDLCTELTLEIHTCNTRQNLHYVEETFNHTLMPCLMFISFLWYSETKYLLNLSHIIIARYHLSMVNRYAVSSRNQDSFLTEHMGRSEN